MLTGLNHEPSLEGSRQRQEKSRAIKNEAQEQGRQTRLARRAYRTAMRSNDVGDQARALEILERMNSGGKGGSGAGMSTNGKQVRDISGRLEQRLQDGKPTRAAPTGDPERKLSFDEADKLARERSNLNGAFSGSSRALVNQTPKETTIGGIADKAGEITPMSGVTPPLLTKPQEDQGPLMQALLSSVATEDGNLTTTSNAPLVGSPVSQLPTQPTPLSAPAPAPLPKPSVFAPQEASSPQQGIIEAMLTAYPDKQPASQAEAAPPIDLSLARGSADDLKFAKMQTEKLKENPRYAKLYQAERDKLDAEKRIAVNKSYSKGNPNASLAARLSNRLENNPKGLERSTYLLDQYSK